MHIVHYFLHIPLTYAHNAHYNRHMHTVHYQGGDFMAYSKLRVERAKENKTQEEVAIAANVCRATISYIENGRVDNIQLGTLKKIAAALGSTVEALFLSGEA